MSSHVPDMRTDQLSRPAFRAVPARRSIKELLLPLFVHVGTSAHNLRADSLGFWRLGERRYWLPRLIFRGTDGDEPLIKLAIFAGLHGDEPAGILGVIDFLRFIEENPFLGRAYHLYIYPLCNPTGYEDGTRVARSGKDLNREFWRGSLEPEVALIEAELVRQRFHGLISLHSDDTSDGLYGFIRGARLSELLLKPALAAAEAALPRNEAAIIDGFHAAQGIIVEAYEGILTAPPGARPSPFEIILESPDSAPLHLQRRAFVLALTEIIREYRRMIAYGANL